MRGWSVALTCLLAACGGPDETEFIPEYADLWCGFVLECGDQAAQTFEGMVDHEDCLAVYGPRIDLVGEGCKYKARKAKLCLRALELATCPAEGESLDTIIPSVCDEVYAKCPSDPDLSPTPSDTGM